MVRRSFFWKLYVSYAVLVIVSAVVIGALVLENLRQNALRETESGLFNTARLVAAMEAANPAHLWSDQVGRQVAEVAADTGLHLALMFANGRMAADSLPNGIRLTPEQVLAQPELRGARGQRFGSSIRALVEGQPEQMLVAVPILVEYETIGYVRVGLPLSRLDERRDALRGRVFMGASLNAVVALGLGFFFARHVTKPLEVIGGVCQKLGQGDFAARIRLRREDEIGTVAATINRMAGEVQGRVQQETRERQRLATLLAVMADGVVAVSARERIAYLNAVAGRLLALDLAKATGMRFDDAVSLSAVLEVYEEARQTGQRVFREVRITGHPCDQVIKVDATALTDPDGQPFGVLLVLHDLTEIRELEEVRRTFTANVSHELKTPLTAIGSLVDTLVEDPEMEPAVRQRFLGRIRAQSERLHRLVMDLLIISRLESQKSAVETGPIAIDRVVSECVQTFVEVARQKKITLRWKPPDQPITISGNEEAVELIVNNLLQNAIVYTPAGGSIELILGAADGAASLSIRDTGVGIAPEHLDRIFERFYRVERSRSRDAGGTGLGLSIVKHLTQALRGQILVESRPGEGSVFTVRLPLV